MQKKLLSTFLVIGFCARIPMARGSDEVSQRPGFIHWTKGRELIKNQKYPEVYSEMSLVIEAYSKEKIKDMVYVQAIREAIGQVASGCQNKAAPLINCDEILGKGLEIYEKYWLSDGAEELYVHQAQKNVADYYFALNKYPKALELYNKVYVYAAKFECVDEHLHILSKILTVNLKMSDQVSFDKNWKWVEFCEKSGKMKGAHFIKDNQKNEVYVRQ